LTAFYGVGGKVFLPDILDRAAEALKSIVRAEAPTQDPGDPNRVFGIVPDPELPACDADCECASVVYQAGAPETFFYNATFSLGDNTYDVSTTATRVVSAGVGRCRSAVRVGVLAFGIVPDLGLEIALARTAPLTLDELREVGDLLGRPTASG
jgi:hypothetical protein